MLTIILTLYFNERLYQSGFYTYCVTSWKFKFIWEPCANWNVLFSCKINLTPHTVAVNCSENPLIYAACYLGFMRSLGNLLKVSADVPGRPASVNIVNRNFARSVNILWTFPGVRTVILGDHCNWQMLLQFWIAINSASAKNIPLSHFSWTIIAYVTLPLVIYLRKINARNCSVSSTHFNYNSLQYLGYK